MGKGEFTNFAVLVEVAYVKKVEVFSEVDGIVNRFEDGMFLEW